MLLLHEAVVLWLGGCSVVRGAHHGSARGIDGHSWEAGVVGILLKVLLLLVLHLLGLLRLLLLLAVLQLQMVVHGLCVPQLCRLFAW